MSAVSVGFAAYFTVLFGLTGSTPLILVAIGLPVAFTILNLVGVKETVYATSIMVLIKIFALVLLLMVVGFYLTQYFDIANYTPFFPNGFNGTLNGAAIIFLRSLVSILSV